MFDYRSVHTRAFSQGDVAPDFFPHPPKQWLIFSFRRRFDPCQLLCSKKQLSIVTLFVDSFFVIILLIKTYWWWKDPVIPLDDVVWSMNRCLKRNPPANFLYKMVGHVPHIKPFFIDNFWCSFGCCNLYSTILLFWTCAPAFYREHLC